jgi:hypothetical protein
MHKVIFTLFLHSLSSLNNSNIALAELLKVLCPDSFASLIQHFLQLQGIECCIGILVVVEININVLLLSQP